MEPANCGGFLVSPFNKFAIDLKKYFHSPPLLIVPLVSPPFTAATFDGDFFVAYLNCAERQKGR
jgi:hypothetical protein